MAAAAVRRGNGSGRAWARAVAMRAAARLVGELCAHLLAERSAAVPLAAAARPGRGCRAPSEGLLEEVVGDPVVPDAHTTRLGRTRCVQPRRVASFESERAGRWQPARRAGRNAARRG